MTPAQMKHLISRFCSKASIPATALTALMMTACYAAPPAEDDCYDGIDNDHNGLTDMEEAICIRERDRNDADLEDEDADAEDEDAAAQKADEGVDEDKEDDDNDPPKG